VVSCQGGITDEKGGPCGGGLIEPDEMGHYDTQQWDRE